MRKISQMMMLGAMAATMWSCSSDNAPDSPDKNDPAFKGDGYLAVQIRLPQVPSSRANDNFDDGTDNEYAVDNVALILFKGATEGEAKVVGCYNLDKKGFENTDPSNDNITTTSLQAVEVANMTLSTSDKLYGLVVVNYEGTLTFTNKKADLAVNKISISSFSDLLSKESGNAFYTGSGANASKFFMTNAVLSKNPGGASNPGTEPAIFTLVDLSANLYSTADEAKKHPAGCIYVERAVAKVTSSQKSTTATIGGQVFDVYIEYALDNCEQQSFVVRNSPAGSMNFAWNLTATGKGFRMIGDAPMPALTNPNHPSVQYYYRTYWCTDPHYDTALTTNDNRPENYDHLEFVSLTETVDGKSVASPLYCHENTFPVNKMTYGNTTRVVYKVTLTPIVSEGTETDGNLYILDGNKKNIFLSAKDVQSRGMKEIIEYPGIAEALEKLKKAGTGNETETYDISDVISVVYGANDSDDKGVFKITGITLNEDAENFDVCFGEGAKEKFEADNASMLEGLINTVNAKNVITKYEGGVSYYDIRVAHFDDDLTPWTEKVGETPNTVYGTGAEAANAYLGRYGMVRNNWYDLTVNNIIGIGSPKVPELDIDLSDDNKKDKKYIAIEIHTMSWAKRTHDYDLE